MTKKLFYLDAYISEFSSTVTSVRDESGVFMVELDATAFFPEEGGQFADTGYIGEHRVLDVKERDGRIFHYTATKPNVGEEYFCRIDFVERYERMRCHTAEHILCGIIHREHGFDNVGFHLGDDIVTFDISSYLDREQLDRIEDEANRIISKCLPVYSAFPKSEELTEISYRSKLDLTEGVRLIYIGEDGEVDICACCAPHVSNTGEIGLIKILDFERHRGGVRITFQAGVRALLDYRARYTATKRISELLCVPQNEVAAATEGLVAECESLRRKLAEISLNKAISEADKITPTEGNLVVYYPELSQKELTEFVKRASNKVGGLLVALSGDEGNIKYMITSESMNLSTLVKQFNLDLAGKGGGKPNCVSGSFSSPFERIKEYFENLKI